jgi:hypothetical protein
VTIVFLVAVIVGLLYARQSERGYTLSAMLMIAAFIWLGIEIHLLNLLGDFFALAVAHWAEIVMALGAVVLLIVPAAMIYIALRDRLDNEAIQKPESASAGSVRSKFERRVDNLMALGYGRTQAELTAIRQMKRDLRNNQHADS